MRPCGSRRRQEGNIRASAGQGCNHLRHDRRLGAAAACAGVPMPSPWLRLVPAVAPLVSEPIEVAHAEAVLGPLLVEDGAQALDDRAATGVGGPARPVGDRGWLVER